MPEEPEIETGELRETIEELREERAEREEQERESAWTRWISLSTALLAVIAAVAALMSGDLINRSLSLKNDSVLKQAQASDQWAYYQAKGIKANTAEQTADLLAASARPGPATDRYRKQATQYRADQKEIQKKATDLEHECAENGKEAEELLHHHHIFAYCVTFTQVAIALSAVAALTRRKPVWYFSLLVGLGGLVFFVYGLVHGA
jgi:hypothetical protein